MYYVQAIEHDNLAHPKSKLLAKILGRERVTKLLLDSNIKKQTGFSFFYRKIDPLKVHYNLRQPITKHCSYRIVLTIVIGKVLYSFFLNCIRNVFIYLCSIVKNMIHNTNVTRNKILSLRLEISQVYS